MPTPPVRIGRYSPSTGNFSTSTTPKTTTETFDIAVGDRFWVQAQVENAQAMTVQTPSVSGGAITWTQEARVPAASASTVSALWGWTGVCTVPATGVTISLIRPSGDALLWGFSVTHVGNSLGVGTIFNANNGTGSSAPSDPKTVSDNSLVIFNVNDWNAVDGASRSFRMSAVESNYLFVSGQHAVYGAYVLNTIAGTFTAGLTAPSTMRWGLIGVEFLGSADEPSPAVLETGLGYILLEDGTPLIF